MNILLISAYRHFMAYPPLGLGYIASHLRQHGFSCAILDCQIEAANQIEMVEGAPQYGMNDQQIRERLSALKPGLIGITSNFTTYHKDAVRVARICKEVFPSVPVVMGGAHPSMDDAAGVLNPNVDFVVRGEGEITFLELARTIKEGGDLSTVDGITYKLNGEVRRNPNRPEIQDLDSLPMPAYDLMRMDLYLKDQRKSFLFAKNTPIGYLFTSRGCPFKCTFCSTTENWRKFRYRSAENVLQEIEFLVRAYGVKELTILDDSFVAKKSRVMEICDGIVQRGIKISWQLPAGAQVWILNRELLTAMAKSGYYRLCLPVETASRNMLKYINKPVKLEKAREVISICNELGIWSIAHIIIGFPEETKEDIQETVDFLYGSDLDFVFIFIAQPLAGSKMYDDFKNLGLLPNNEAIYNSSYWNSKYNTRYLKAEELNRMRTEITNGFARGKMKKMLTWRGLRVSLLPKLSSFDKVLYICRVALYMAKMSLEKKRLKIMPPSFD